MNILRVSEAWLGLERTVAAVKGADSNDSNIAKALPTLKTFSRKECIPLAIIGGLAAIHYGYERYTKDIDIVASSTNLDTLTRVAPQYGIKVIRNDPKGRHKLMCEGVSIDVVPEGGMPRKDAPIPIPGPERLGVREGAEFAEIAGWIETKVASFRRQDQADVIRVLKANSAADLERIRGHLGGTHSTYLRRFDELVVAAEEEKEQERDRGGVR